MDTSINLQDNFIDKLLSLSDDMKLRIINKLFARTKAEDSTMEFIDSLVLKGGEPVPENISDISSLLDEKYM